MQSVRSALLTYGVHLPAERGEPARCGGLDDGTQGQGGGLSPVYLPRVSGPSVSLLAVLARPIAVPVPGSAGLGERRAECPQPPVTALHLDGHDLTNAHPGRADDRCRSTATHDGRLPRYGSLAKRFCERPPSAGRHPYRTHMCTHRRRAHRTKGPCPAPLRRPAARMPHPVGTLSTLSSRRTGIRRAQGRPYEANTASRRRATEHRPSNSARALTTGGWNRMAFHGIWCEPLCPRADPRSDGLPRTAASFHPSPPHGSPRPEGKRPSPAASAPSATDHTPAAASTPKEIHDMTSQLPAATRRHAGGTR